MYAIVIRNTYVPFICHPYDPVASSLVNLVSSMVPNVTMNTYFIVVMCGIDPGLIIQSCEVIARNDRRTVIGKFTMDCEYMCMLEYTF